MKISEVVITPVAFSDPPLRNPNGVHTPWALRAILQIRTDDGYEGVGETTGSKAVLEELESVRSELLGADPFQIERLQQRVSSSEVMAAVDHACLDIMGKHAGRPVCDIIGGRVRDDVEFSAYLFFKFGEDEYGEVLTPTALLNEAELFHARHGFRVHKLKAGVLSLDEDIETVRLLRERFGDEHLVRVDATNAWSVDESIEFAERTDQYDVEYLEDPTSGLDNLAKLRASVDVPLSTHTSVSNFDHIEDAVRKESIDIVSAEIHKFGGILACKQVGKICEAVGWGMSMHTHSHMGISLMAMVHLAASTPQLSHALDTQYIWTPDDVLKGGKIPIVGGRVEVPNTPGLGVEIDDDRLAMFHQNYVGHAHESQDRAAELRKWLSA